MKSFSAILLALFAAGEVAVGDLVFEKTLLEFHVGADEKSLTADFPFRNDGDKTVHIVKSESGCSCLNVGVAGGKFEYAPGEVGVIRAIFDLRSYSGTTERLVSIWHGENKDTPSSTRLTVRAHIPVLVHVEPKNLTWETQAVPQPGVFKITMDPSKKLNVGCSSENFNLEVNTLEDGVSYEIIVTPKSTDTPGIGVLRIETDSENERFKTQTVFTIIRNPTPAPAPAGP
jgi:hypothetical protein